MDEPDYVVLRIAPDLPRGFIPARFDGLWLSRPAHHARLTRLVDGAVAVPTGRFEVRDDGAVAEVYEFRR